MEKTLDKLSYEPGMLMRVVSIQVEDDLEIDITS